MGSRVGGVATLAVVCACSGPSDTEAFPTLPIRYETQQLRIGTSFEEPLCTRDLARLDRHIARVEAQLGLTDAGPHTLLLYKGFPIPGCGSSALGCYNPEARAAAAGWGAADHELVHAISADLGRPADFWNEGTAEALSFEPTLYEPAGIADVADDQARDFSYAVAGHFVRWLMDWGGSDAFLELFTSDDFEATYGMSLAAVEAIYHDEVPEVLPPLEACDDMPLPLEPDGSLDLELDIDCGDETVSRVGHGYQSGFIADVRTLTVEEDMTLSIRMDGGFALLIGGCPRDAGPHVEQLGDVVNETVEPLGRTHFDPDVEHEVRLPAFTYRVSIVVEAVEQSVPARLQIAPL